MIATSRASPISHLNEDSGQTTLGLVASALEPSAEVPATSLDFINDETDREEKLHLLHDKDVREIRATYLGSPSKGEVMGTGDYHEVSDPLVVAASKTAPTGGDEANDLKVQEREQIVDFDMFAEEDMFAEVDPSKPPAALATITRTGHRATLADNWDDPEGYYQHLPGEVLKDKYTISTALGRGVFSTVVKAIDQATQEEKAIKLIRSNETMRKAGMRETSLLTKIEQYEKAQRKSRNYIIRLDEVFEYRNHLCLVFESLAMNLRELLKKFGAGVGLNIRAVQLYASQLFQGLMVLKKCRILHAGTPPLPLSFF